MDYVDVLAFDRSNGVLQCLDCPLAVTVDLHGSHLDPKTAEECPQP